MSHQNPFSRVSAALNQFKDFRGGGTVAPAGFSINFQNQVDPQLGGPARDPPEAPDVLSVCGMLSSGSSPLLALTCWWLVVPLDALVLLGTFSPPGASPASGPKDLSGALVCWLHLHLHMLQLLLSGACLLSSGWTRGSVTRTRGSPPAASWSTTAT